MQVSEIYKSRAAVEARSPHVFESQLRVLLVAARGSPSCSVPAEGTKNGNDLAAIELYVAHEEARDPVSQTYSQTVAATGSKLPCTNLPDRTRQPADPSS